MLHLQPRALEEDDGKFVIKFREEEQTVYTEDDALKAMCEKMNEIEGVTDDPLTIEFHKVGLAPLEFVDLPGIVAASMAGEPIDMKQRTHSIAERYLHSEETVFIVTVPANISRVRDATAVQLLQQHGRVCDAVALLTKVDLAYDPLHKQRNKATPYWQLEARLDGSADDMPEMTWLAVKNRDTMIPSEENNSGLSNQNEATWFTSNTSRTVLSKCGISAVIDQIDALLTAHILKTWVPKAMLHVNSRIDDIDAKLLHLGVEPSSLSVADVLVERARERASERGSVTHIKVFQDQCSCGCDCLPGCTGTYQVEGTLGCRKITSAVNEAIDILDAVKDRLEHVRTSASL